MRTIYTIAALTAAANAIKLGSKASSKVSQEDTNEFLDYCAMFGKTYSSQTEFDLRQQAFSVVNNWIKEANENDEDTATYALNQFSDWTADEISKMFMNPDDMQPLPPSDDEASDNEGEDSGDESEPGEEEQQDSGDESEPEQDSGDESEPGEEEQQASGDEGEPSEDEDHDSGDEDQAADNQDTSAAQTRKWGKNNDPDGPVAPSDPSGSGDDSTPASTVGVDWRTQGVVNPVKNQGQCGSCWAFGSNAQMESLYAIKTGTLYNLSEQQLVDCASKGNNGCNGGFMTNVFNYYSNKKYMMETSEYKYKGRQTKCKYDSSNASPVQTKRNGTVQTYNEDEWKTALSTQVLSIAVAAGNNYFMNYSSGILNTSDCPTSIDHAVAMVGWGQDSTTGQDYWIVRNSWGENWGEAGYIRIATSSDGDGVCMVQSTPVTVTMD